jgi:hypothetical protein
MKRLILWGTAIPFVFLTMACGPQPAANMTVGASVPAVSAPPISNTKQDALLYISEMKSKIDNMNAIRAAYETFLKDCEAGRYGPTEVVNQVTTFNGELQNIQIQSASVNVPPSMTQYHQMFLQSLTDLSNSASSMQDAAIHSLTGPTKKDTDNAQHFLDTYDSEFVKYLTDINNLAK